MSKEKNLKIAIKYGVPTPETCEILMFQKPTNYCWYYNKEAFQGLSANTYYLAIMTYDDMRNIFVLKNQVKMYSENITTAPQMHEIAQNLPNYRVIDGEEYYLALKSYSQKEEDSMFYLQYVQRCNPIITKDYFPCWDNNFAETYATMYIDLKERGLL